MSAAVQASLPAVALEVTSFHSQHRPIVQKTVAVNENPGPIATWWTLLDKNRRLRGCIAAPDCPLPVIGHSCPTICVHLGPSRPDRPPPRLFWAYWLDRRWRIVVEDKQPNE